MYLTYDEYLNFGGGLEQSAFENYEFEAAKKIEAATFGRINEPGEAVKRCTFRLTELAAESAGAGSFSHDGLSVSIDAEALGKKADEIIYNYLINETADGVPLLYRGDCYAADI